MDSVTCRKTLPPGASWYLKVPRRKAPSRSETVYQRLCKTPDFQAGKLSADGSVAMMSGDTLTARTHHKAAAKLFLAESRRQRWASDRELYKFLAATQYYLGGHYVRAVRVCRRIEGKYLVDHHRSGFEAMYRRARERSKPNYVVRIRALLDSHMAASRWADVLEVLKLHQYVLPRVEMAAVRAKCCTELGHHEVAKWFRRDVEMWVE